jgi:hypothetical protein
MLLSEARPRPYRTNYEERSGKFAPSSSPGYNNARDVDYEKILAPDSSFKKNTDKKDKEIDWHYSLALQTVMEYNMKYPSIYCGKSSVSVGYYIDYYSAGVNNRFVYLYLYDSFSIKASKDSYKALEKSKLFEYGKRDVTDNLFPELKEIGNKVKITISYDEKSQSISIRYDIRIGSMSDIDVNLNAEGRAAQLDKLVHRTLDRVSLGEIINRIIKLLTNMLRTVKSGGEIQNTVE